MDNENYNTMALLAFKEIFTYPKQIMGIIPQWNYCLLQLKQFTIECEFAEIVGRAGSLLTPYTSTKGYKSECCWNKKKMEHLLAQDSNNHNIFGARSCP